MTTPKQIEEAIKARQAELQGVVEAHEKERKIFLQNASQRQMKVTHLEGCIAQLRQLLPKPKGATKKKK